MNIRSALLPCSLLLFSCTQIPKDQAATDGEVQPTPAPQEAVAAADLPEVRYYLIADT